MPRSSFRCTHFSSLLPHCTTTLKCMQYNRCSFFLINTFLSVHPVSVRIFQWHNSPLKATTHKNVQKTMHFSATLPDAITSRETIAATSAWKKGWKLPENCFALNYGLPSQNCTLSARRSDVEEKRVHNFPPFWNGKKSWRLPLLALQFTPNSDGNLWGGSLKFDSYYRIFAYARRNAIVLKPLCWNLKALLLFHTEGGSSLLCSLNVGNYVSEWVTAYVLRFIPEQGAFFATILIDNRVYYLKWSRLPADSGK